ncbi:hypothetical protein F5888DRAFT_1805718 [Russula emetica]|nr:hypothetical protein F5888DRAFT_1805718 [Russula emetica]
MPQTTSEDLEKGNEADNDHWQSTPDPSQPQKLSGDAPDFGDSSGPLFSIYPKAAEDEDNKMVERWQKDADGILIFNGLFSAAVATLLSVLADPNATRPSIPYPVAKPPPFSPPRYTVWVNSLWFLSLVMSLSCALLATSLHQWARRYLRLTRPSQCRPEKRARMRAFYANGVDRMYVPWAVEGFPTLVHLSVFFFFGGLVIFLFNNDHEVFSYVIWWIGLFSVVYGLITLLPLIRHDSPYNSPLSTPAWFLYSGILYATFKGLIFLKPSKLPTLIPPFYFVIPPPHYHKLRDRYRRWMFGGVEKAAEETAEERSSEIDIRILDWTVSTLGDDDSLRNFFESIPGFFSSKMLKHKRKIPLTLRVKFCDALHGFWERTWSSNSINDLEKARRLDISLHAMSRTHDYDAGVWSILYDILIFHVNDMIFTVEMGDVIARWCNSDNQGTADCARALVAITLVLVPVHWNDSWVTLATRVFGPLEGDVRDSIADGGDSVLLAIFIQVARQSIPTGGSSPFFSGFSSYFGRAYPP